MLQPETLKSSSRLEWSTGRGIDVWDLFLSCVSGDLANVTRLVDADPTLIGCQHAYRTPLYFAVRSNQRSVVEFLLDQGADPFGSVVGESLLQMAQDRDYGDMVHLLKSKFQELYGYDERVETVLDSIRSGDLPSVKNTLDAHPELISASDGRSNQPIHWAVMCRQLPIIDELLARGANLEAERSDGARPIHLFNGDYFFRGWRDANAEGCSSREETLQHLLTRGATCDLNTACHLGDLNRVKEILKADGSQVNRVSRYVSYYMGSGAPLTNAAKGGHLEVVRWLLDAGADPNLEEVGIAPKGQALYVAAADGNHEMAKLLLERGAFPNPPVESSADALSRAIDNKDDAMVELLSSHGASRSVEIMAYYNDLRTAAAVFHANPKLADDSDALANAAGNGHMGFVQLMLRYQPDLAKHLVFPSWLVAESTKEMVEFLFRKGMNPNELDWQLVAPLHEIAGRGNLELAQQYLEHGADIHARDLLYESTPLGWAARTGQTEMVEFLVGKGALPVHPEDPNWATPIAWAKRRGHSKIAEFLSST
jgi:ankyrin repeat protein